MKHGDKAKGKASKASKTSDKKVSKAGGSKSKAPETKGREAKASSKVEKSAAKAGGKGPSKGLGKGTAAKAGSASRAPEGNGARAATGDVSFGNPIIAAAFKRASKKYSNAFRRLTD
jgi:hypothetical protein